ncbi:hypothetical protein [Burkholderia glumae]|uniref:hypothetical protein n=1 Tax=Burkholderia glumae TaxID=337 RepID=UPI001594929A|nr:hypothetical protein [Burkholderia glumae]MCM2494041.1 hypothetical protein [Burkholderia glumae]NVE24133.1 hypothetical protein [Burkholderia glumae]
MMTPRLASFGKLVEIFVKCAARHRVSIDVFATHVLLSFSNREKEDPNQNSSVQRTGAQRHAGRRRPSTFRTTLVTAISNRKNFEERENE